MRIFWWRRLPHGDYDVRFSFHPTTAIDCIIIIDLLFALLSWYCSFTPLTNLTLSSACFEHTDRRPGEALSRGQLRDVLFHILARATPAPRITGALLESLARSRCGSVKYPIDVTERKRTHVYQSLIFLETCIPCDFDFVHGSNRIRGTCSDVTLWFMMYITRRSESQNNYCSARNEMKATRKHTSEKRYGMTNWEG